MKPGAGHRSRRCTTLVAACLPWLAACGAGDPASAPATPATPTAATLGTQDLRPPREWLAEAPYAGADEARGNRLLLQCRSCHNLEADAGHTLGPNLHGMFGRAAGRAAGFGYTRAFQAAEFVWTPRALDAWLAAPSQFLPGNAMAYGGLRDPDDRAALIASLLRQTMPPDE